MADTISAWIAPLVVLHDRRRGASFIDIWRGSRFCQVVEFKTYRTEQHPKQEIHAIASDADHRIHLVFDVDATDAFEEENDSLTSHLRSVFELKSFKLQLLPPLPEPEGIGSNLPRVALHVLDWSVVSGDRSNPVLFEDTEQIGADPIEKEIRDILHKWWTGRPESPTPLHHSLPSPEPTPEPKALAQTKPPNALPALPSPSQPNKTHESIPLEAFLEKYINPAEGKKAKPIPDWLFEVPEDARKELDTINVFGIDLHGESDDQAEHGVPSSPAFPQPGQRLPSDIQTPSGRTQSSRFEQPPSDSDDDILVRPMTNRRRQPLFFDDTLGPLSSPPGGEFDLAHSQAQGVGADGQDSDLDDLTSQSDGEDEDDLSDYSRQQRIARRKAQTPVQTVHVEAIETRSVEISVEVPISSNGTQEQQPASVPKSQPIPVSEQGSAAKSQQTLNGPASQPGQESNSLTESFSASQKSTEEFSLSRYAGGQDQSAEKKTPGETSSQTVAPKQSSAEGAARQEEPASLEAVPGQPQHANAREASQAIPSSPSILSGWRQSRQGSTSQEAGRPEKAPADALVITCAKKEHISPEPQTQPLVTHSPLEQSAQNQNGSQREQEQDGYEWPDNLPPPPSPPPARHLAFSKSLLASSGGKFTPTSIKRESGVGSSGRRTFTPTIVRRSIPDVFGSIGIAQASPTVSRFQGLRRTREEFQGGDLSASQLAKQRRTEQVVEQGDEAMKQRSEDEEVVSDPLLRPAPGERLTKIRGFRPDLSVTYGLDANWVLTTAEKAKKQRAGTR